MEGEGMKLRNRAGMALAASTAWLALAPNLALAQAPANEDQAPPAQAADEDSSQTIIVTGTLLRGITPPGSQTIAVSKEEAIATGATTTAQLLANVPQIGDFNARPAYRGVYNIQGTVNHPELRNLTGNLVGSSATLLLVDGRRLPGMGVRQTTPDSDAIAPGAIERVEIVPDGGSSIYGADAVGGVINYITRKRFSGVEVSANYGFADDYQTASADLTAGTDWGSGSAFITYSYNWHDEIYGTDRDYVGRPGAAISCTPGNVVIGTAIYKLPTLTPSATGNTCDVVAVETIYPAEERHSLYAGFTQEFSDNLEIHVSGYYTHRRNRSDGGPHAITTAKIKRFLADGTTLNPFYRDTGDANSGKDQTIQFDWAPIDTVSEQVGILETWGVSSELTWNLGNGWRVRGMFNYGRGTSTSDNASFNTTALNSRIAQGVFDPYNLTNPANAPYLHEFTDDYSLYGLGEHELIQGRVIADGDLFHLPGGEVSLAVGAEYIYEDYFTRTGTGYVSARPSFITGGGNRTDKALFYELFIPLVGADNSEKSGIHSLALSASGRYDHYDDFGSTFNPKFALTLEPVDWLKIRANWSKSFQAPSLADGAGAATNSITIYPSVPFRKAGVDYTPGDVTIFLSGAVSPLKPQKANIWSVGFDVAPTLIDGLAVSLTYYNIKFRDRIATPDFTRPDFYTLYPDEAIAKPDVTTAWLQYFVDQIGGTPPPGLIPYLSNVTGVYAAIDSRRGNFAAVNTSGLDFNVNYSRPTNFGSIYARFAGNYVLTRTEQLTPIAPKVNSVDTGSRLTMSTTLGATVGNLLGQVTWSYRGSFSITPSAANQMQSEVGSFSLFNLFFKYDLKGEGVLNDTSLTLNVDNVFDTEPPIYRDSQFGYGNGFTLGRLVQFGIRKKF
jgi:iron complex outermembrane receptor protein